MPSRLVKEGEGGLGYRHRSTKRGTVFVKIGRSVFVKIGTEIGPLRGVLHACNHMFSSIGGAFKAN